jgi:WD40 repeat protein
VNVALGGDGVRLWTPGSGEVVSVGPAFAVRLAFSPDGARLAAACGDGVLRVWKTGPSAEPALLRGHGDPVDAVAWRPDGARIASGGRDGKVRVWDAVSGTTLLTIEPKSGWINGVAWSPDGRLLAVAHGRLTIWDPESGRLRETPSSRRERIVTAVFSPDGRRLAWAGAESGVQVQPLSAGLLPGGDR